MCSERVLLLLISCCATFVSGQQSHYVNIAPGKSYSQISSHVLQSSPGNAANGNTDGFYTADNCIHTNSSNTLPVPYEPHWWQVDLGQVYPVYNITVWGRDNYAWRLYPFRITVDDQLCVTVTSFPGTRELSVTCTNIMYGRVVRLTRTTNAILNLCELQIYVCDSGYYGADCNSPCDAGCDGGCYIDTGNCTNCKNGFWGPQKCEQNCSSHCLTSYCQRANGHCTGCKSGYHGDKCDKPCSSLTLRCTQCRQDNGICTACSGHFVLPTCTDCAKGYYKNSGGCQQCSSDCKNQQCDPNTGKCNACPDGWYGMFCNTPCSPGCGRCHQYTGSCEACATNSNLLFPGCTECEDGYYKQSPSKCIRCPGTCDNNSPCDKTTGRCEECPPGTQGDFCQQACTDNTYGQNCSESCGHCQGGQPCDPETGHCTTGCQPGYTGQLCETECEAGRYGTDCSQPCGYCQVNTTCHHQDGRCPAGCAPGLLEPLCLQVQEKQVAEGNLDAPVVAGSVIGAAVIVSIAVIAAVCWYRRSTRQPAENRASTVPMKRDTATAPATATNSPVHRPPTVVEDTAYYEISDTANALEMQEAENNYDKLHPYNNSDADREPYATMTPSASDVKQSSSDTANVYVNSAMSGKLDSL